MSPIDVRPIIMLVVEDNKADVVFFNEAVLASQTPAAIHVIDNGHDAMHFLRRRPPFADAPRPDVVVLDLNIPLRNGHDVLIEMAGDRLLRTIPVAILTTSTAETHVCDVYPPGRCLYFAKTDDFRRLQEIVQQIAAHARRAH